MKSQKPDLSLYLVTDRALCFGRDLLDVVKEAIKGGVTIVQLREKKQGPAHLILSDREIYEWAVKMKQLTASYNIPLLINDRIDIALASNADGVHLGQNDIPAGKARELLGDDAIIGLSVETVSEAKEANTLDVDYIAVSPVFATPTKTDTRIEWGLKGVQKIKALSKHPVVAIGGITACNASQIIETGADGIAVVSAICSAKNPYKKAKEIKEEITKHFGHGKDQRI